MRYLLTNPDDFGGLTLSDLPLNESDSTTMGARALFDQFLRLAGYARLKRDLAGGTDDIVSIFENQVDEQVYQLIAELTRREEAVVRAVAHALYDPPLFANELVLQRVWEALQVIDRLGVPVASLVGWTGIVGVNATHSQRFNIARELKGAIKARLEPETWLSVARPIFDKLRQEQRNALVDYVMYKRDFSREEQLYEYFLIDPGMEPVVQTSRIRLAIASVQLFIQRILLNLEKQVHPSVINAKHWEWMKRYRVWEANRKIYLFPENWLEPEFRDDKTHLFTELEGTLLQDDVSSDLVENAFLNYLKKLEELAQLDIVAMHLEDGAAHTPNTLHVIGRTSSQPHKYFCRRYSDQMWTPWEPVSAEIEGDHLAPVVWRDRLYLFWVTFLDKADDTATPASPTSDDGLASVSLSDAMSDVRQTGNKKKVEIQLHWSAYIEGEWSRRESSEFIPVTFWLTGPRAFGSVYDLRVDRDEDYRSVLIYTSKEPYENGEERGIFIHLGAPINQGFYLEGRNGVPERADHKDASPIPFSSETMTIVNSTQLRDRGKLTARYRQLVFSEDGSQNYFPDYIPILDQAGAYRLLLCNDIFSPRNPGVETIRAQASKTALRATGSDYAEIESAMKPFFYQDNAHTFFVEPNVYEPSVEDWREWLPPLPDPDPQWDQPDWWTEIKVTSQIPKFDRPVQIDPNIPDGRPPISSVSLLDVMPHQDWLINSSTSLVFHGGLMGPGGWAGPMVLPATEGAGNFAVGGTPLKVQRASDVAGGSTAVVTARNPLNQVGLTQANSGLNVVGGSGFHAAPARNVEEFGRSEG